MRLVLSLLSKLNRPLPGWLTLSLFLGAAALAAPPVFNGSLKLLTGATITDTNATASTCVGTNGSKQYGYGINCITSMTAGSNIQPLTGPTPTVAVTAAPTFSGETISNPSALTQLYLSAQGANNATVDIHSAGNTSYTRIYNDTPSPSNLTQAADIQGFMGGLTHAELAMIEMGNAGGTAGDQGGFIAFSTKLDNGTGNLAENLVLTPGAHVFFADRYAARFNTPSSCTGGTECGTTSWTFTYPFATTSGVAAQPTCLTPSIWDETSNTTMWVGSINTVSSTGVTFNYASLANVASAHTIDIWAYCFSSAF